MPDSLGARLQAVRQTIARSAERAGRDPSEVVLVTVTKGFPVARIREALAAGLRILGENRVQEALPKIDEIGPANIDWHLIGHLQTNRPVFRQLRALRDKTSQQLGVALPVLSMGMTDDYAIAVEEGATMLRLGRALFGPR